MSAKRISLVMALCFAISLAVAGGASGMDLSGKVAETMNSGGYTYILLENGSGKNWAAVPQTEIAVGDEVQLQPGMMMQNFTSKTMNRTFESIIFSGGLAR